MMHDFGGDNYTNSSLQAKSYINEIIQNFTVIIVREKFDESLVVMKNKLNWEWSDIIYTSKNERKEYNFDRTDEKLKQNRHKVQ